jgi:thioredoxin reductase (NADPH)
MSEKSSENKTVARKSNLFDVAIVGSGPAGLTAAIYSSRFGLKTVLFSGPMPGGQLTTTSFVENWPAEEKIDGSDLMDKMRKHAKSSGTIILDNSVKLIKPIKATTEEISAAVHSFQRGNNDKSDIEPSKILARSVIVATGSKRRPLGVKGEKELIGSGLSFCAVCDGPLYKGKEVLIAGGGNSAIAEAFILLNYAKKIWIVTIDKDLTATDPLKEKVVADDRVSLVTGAKITELSRQKGEERIKVELSPSIPTEKDKTDKNPAELTVDGLFVSIGLIPNSSIVEGIIELDEKGYIVRKNNTQTSIKNIFAAGDVADRRYKQAITAAGDGCMAAIDAYNYLKENKKHKEKELRTTDTDELLILEIS